MRKLENILDEAQVRISSSDIDQKRANELIMQLKKMEQKIANRVLVHPHVEEAD